MNFKRNFKGALKGLIDSIGPIELASLNRTHWVGLIESDPLNWTHWTHWFGLIELDSLNLIHCIGFSELVSLGRTHWVGLTEIGLIESGSLSWIHWTHQIGLIEWIGLVELAFNFNFTGAVTARALGDYASMQQLGARWACLVGGISIYSLCLCLCVGLFITPCAVVNLYICSGNYIVACLL